MSNHANIMRDFIASHPWWCVLIVAAMFWIPRAGIWMAVGSWLAIIAVCAKHRALPAAKVNARVVSSGSSMVLNVGDGVTRYDVFGMCYYKVPKSAVGSTVLCVEREPQNSHDKNALKVSVNGRHIGYVSVWAAADIAPAWDSLGVTSMDVHGRVINALDAYVEIPTNSALREALAHPDTSKAISSMRPSAHPQLLSSVSAMMRTRSSTARTQTPVKPWGPCVRNYKLAATKKFKAGITRVCVSCGEDGKREKVRLDDLDAQVRLTPNHKLAVFIDDVQVGMVPDEARESYRHVVEELHSSHQCLLVPASIWMTRKNGFKAGVSVKFPLPDEVKVPVGMPSGPVAILPQGRKVQVTGEENHTEALLGLLAGEHSVPVVAELKSFIKKLKTTERTVVGVKVGGVMVGLLSTQMSQHFRPVVEACEDAGTALVCHGRITGNQLKVDLVLEAVKGSELPPEWVKDNVYGHANRPVDVAGASVTSLHQGESSHDDRLAE